MMSNESPRVLIADDEESLRFVLGELLSREGCDVTTAVDGREAVELAHREPYDLYLLDMKMPRLDGLGALREIRARQPDALAVMITAFGSQQFALEALQAGAFDHFTKPFNIEELRLVLTRALERQRLLRKIQELELQLTGEARLGRMIGAGAAMRQVFSLVERVAGHDVTVLITGESGTGKELVAQAIHEQSPRRDGPFIKVNCAAIPEPLLESELFGHEKGAFTGATCARPGRFELAHGGTILLDEIGEMPLALQAKLLRVLQEREVERVGSSQPRPVDIRVLAATNRDLEAMVEMREFREDLFFRINVLQIHLPPLRKRTEDLPALIQFFVGSFNSRLGKRIEGFTPEAMGLLERHAWPGNIRELENTIQRAMVLSAGARIGVEALPDAMRSPGPGHGNGNGAARHSVGEAVADRAEDFALPLAERIEQITEAEERRIIVAALGRMNGRRQETADLLGISRKSLHNKMQKYGLFENGDE